MKWKCNHCDCGCSLDQEGNDEPLHCPATGSMTADWINMEEEGEQ